MNEAFILCQQVLMEHLHCANLHEALGMQRRKYWNSGERFAYKQMRWFPTGLLQRAELGSGPSRGHVRQEPSAEGNSPSAPSWLLQGRAPAEHGSRPVQGIAQNLYPNFWSFKNLFSKTFSLYGFLFLKNTLSSSLKCFYFYSLWSIITLSNVSH